ncbi:hypothetical protein [Teichococcus rhizosphaerae]|nr:hypothetical protein [Pseudoroseomonas rhizosphaerae]
MAGFFLTTAGLRVSLLWANSPLAKYIRNSPTEEIWVSPLSHAIMKDQFFGESGASPELRKRGYQAVEMHARQMARINPTQYPYPDEPALDIWAQIRSLEVNIAAYDDGVAQHVAQQLGPDELLVFATAAAHLKPLIGPAPDDPDTLRVLDGLGIRFVPASTWLGAHGT